MKYIDAEKLKAEIERLKDTACRRADNRYGREDANTYEAWAGAYEKVLEILDAIPEQPVEGLEEEVKRYYSENFAYITSDQPTLSILTNIARHFAEWGKNNLK